MERKIWLAGVFVLFAFKVFSQNNVPLKGDNLQMKNRGVEGYKPSVPDEIASEPGRYRFFARLRSDKNNNPAKTTNKETEEKRKYFYKRQTKTDDRS